MNLFRRRRRPAPVPPPASTPVLVLVADDDPVVREVLQVALEQHGWSVVAVGDGQSAVEAAVRHRPSAAVLDWLMPGLYGPDVCAALRADARTASVPLVLLTTQGEQRDVAHAFRSGADEYVTKPFHPREVVRVVERLLADPPARPQPAEGSALTPLDGAVQELESVVGDVHEELGREQAGGRA